MKAIRLFIAVFTLIAFPFFEIAAQEHIGFTGTSFTSSNVALGDTIFFTTYLKNHHNGSFSDTIGFNLSVNGVLVNDNTVFPNPLSGQIINIPGHDSLSVAFIIVASPPYFAVGPDGIVVWPKVDMDDTLDVHDSIFYQINILPVGIEETNYNSLSIWNGEGKLHVFGTIETYAETQLSIYSITGASIFSKRVELPFDLTTSGWEGGIYFVHVQTKGGDKKIFEIYISANK